LVFAPKDISTSAVAAGRPVQAVDTGINVPLPSSASSPVSGSDAIRQDSNPQSSSLDPVDLVRQPNVPGIQQAPEGAARQGDDFYIGGNGGGTVISVPKPSTAAVPDAPPVERAVPAPVQTAPKPAAPAPAPIVQTQSRPATVQTKVYNDYWVQTGAFSTIAKAEGVKDTLTSKGITSIIENREVDGRTVFRVRVGPYTSQNEANYWLSLIKSISGFEDSQVRQTQSRR
jgi:DedD protein